MLFHRFRYFFLFTVLFLSGALSAQHYRLIAPKPDFVFADSTINFRWNKVDSALTYDLMVARDPGFLNVVHTENAITGTTFQRGFIPGSMYYWRVRANNAQGPQAWSYHRQFSIFTPQNFPGLAAWFDAGRNVVSSSNRVSRWTDLSSANLAAAQTVTNNQPTLVATIAQLNNRPVIRFSGSSSTPNFLTFTPMTLTNFSAFMVRNYTANSNLMQYVVGGAASGLCAAASYYTAGYGVYSNFQGADALFASNTASLSTAYSIYSIQKSRIARNGVQPTLAQSKQIPGVTLSALGTRPDVTAFAFQGDLAEVVIFNNAMDTNNIRLMEGYLRYKYSKHVDIGADTVMNTLCVSLTIPATTGFTSYLWSTGATTSSITVTKFGKYWVRATDIFGYVSTDTMEIRPKIAFTQLPKNITLCRGDSVVWNTGYPATGYQFTWSTGATTPSLVIKNAGNYFVRIRDGVNCTYTSDTITVAVDNFPNHKLGPDTSFCAANRLNFGYAGALNSILWSNGDTTSTTPIYTSGNYSVVAVNVNGCIAGDTIYANVKGPAPTANFTFEGVCLADTSRFKDQSVQIPTDPVASWKWTFGNGQNSTLQNPQVVYDSLKSYTVTLLITSDSGCTDAISKTVRIGAIPVADFAYPPIQCLGGFAKFSDNSSVLVTDTITQWQWIFNQTDTINNRQPSYTFPNLGVIPVSLKVTTTRGCTHTTHRVVEVFKEFKANFTYTDVCLGDSTKFTDLTSSFSIVKWQWNFGDGTFLSTLQNPKHKFKTPEVFPVRLMVENAIGCVDTLQKMVSIVRRPTASFISPNICEGSRYTPLDNSLSPSEPIAAWQWTMNGIVFNRQSPRYVFPDTGSYAVKLSITTASGCRDSVSRTVSVTPNPIAAFTYTPLYGEAPLKVNFTNKSEGAVTYTWDFGDSSPTSTSKNPSHTYTYNDTFQITLRSYTDKGCVDSVAKTYIVVPTTLDLSVDDVRTQSQVQTDGSVLVSVTTSMSNLGTRLITDARLYATLGTGGIISEDWQGTLTTGQRMDYRFDARFVLSPEVINNTYVCVDIRTVNNGETEIRTDNNRQCHSVNGQLQLVGPYPNPSHTDAKLGLILPRAGTVTIEISDLYGRTLVPRENLTLPAGRSDYIIPVNQLQAATYIIHIAYLDELRFIKFIVK